MESIKRKTRVLVVDDDDFSRKLVEADLSGYGFHVEVSPSSQDAMKKILEDRTSYDVIVSDLCMPGDSGAEFLTKLRAQSIQTPFFIMTGDESFTAEGALSCGGQGLIKKPFRVGRLAVKIALCLAQPRSGAEPTSES